MIEKLEIHHLRTLSVLYRVGRLSVAAEQLGVSQQAVSLQLKNIRQILGDELFVRSGHGMAATPYARLIEPHIEAILSQLNQFPRPDSLADSHRTLVLSATDYTQEVIVARLLPLLRQTLPMVRLIVRPIESANLTQKMQLGEIDLALTSHGYVPEGLIHEPLFVESYRCVTANKALSQAGTLSLAKLTELDFIVTSPGTGSLTGSADAWFEQQGHQRRIVASAPSFHITQEYLRQSDMVAFLPARLLPCQGLFDIPLEKYPPGYEVVAAFHPSSRTDPLLNWLLQQIHLLA